MQNSPAPKLEDQLCFPFYVIAKEITGMYRPFLDELGMTYSQFLVMMVLWEEDGVSVKSLGEKLYLDSGTLTPLLKRLEAKNYILRKRKLEDERSVEIFLTKEGDELRNQACSIPGIIQKKMNLSEEEIIELKTTVRKLLKKIEK